MDLYSKEEHKEEEGVVAVSFVFYFQVRIHELIFCGWI